MRRGIRWLAGLLALLPLTILAACGSPGASTTAQSASCDAVAVGDAAAGEELFRHTLSLTNGRGPNCLTCHALETDAPETVGPGLRGIANVAGSRVPALSAEEYLCQSILYPREYIVEGYPDDIILMPVTYGAALSQQQLNDLITYMLTLDG